MPALHAMDAEALPAGDLYDRHFDYSTYRFNYRYTPEQYAARLGVSLENCPKIAPCEERFEVDGIQYRYKVDALGRKVLHRNTDGDWRLDVVLESVELQANGARKELCVSGRKEYLFGNRYRILGTIFDEDTWRQVGNLNNRKLAVVQAAKIKKAAQDALRAARAAAKEAARPAKEAERARMRAERERKRAEDAPKKQAAREAAKKKAIFRKKLKAQFAYGAPRLGAAVLVLGGAYAAYLWFTGEKQPEKPTRFVCE